MAVLASLGGQWVWVGVPLSAAQGRGVPAGLQLPGEGVHGLPALGLGRDPPWVAAGVREAPALGGRRVGQCLEAQFRRNGLVG